jgi:hypothetical protein
MGLDRRIGATGFEGPEMSSDETSGRSVAVVIKNDKRVADTPAGEPRTGGGK